MSGKVGRPVGTRLSQETKKQISKSRTGYKHSDKTKQRISRGLGVHWTKVKEAERKDMFEMYDDAKLSVKDIAKIYGVSVKTVYKLVRERDGLSRSL